MTGTTAWAPLCCSCARTGSSEVGNLLTHGHARQDGPGAEQNNGGEGGRCHSGPIPRLGCAHGEKGKCERDNRESREHNPAHKIKG